MKAQVLVHEEPIHAPKFQNDQIRILNVKLAPGDTTQYHIHHTPSIFIYFTGTAVVSQLQGGIPITSTSTACNTFYKNLSAPHLRIHRVWNIDQNPLLVMDIEILSQNEVTIQKQLRNPGLQVVVDTADARVYRLSLSEKNKLN